VSVGVFEQVVWEIAATPPQPGCPLRLVAYTVDTDRIEANVAWFKGEVLPGILADPGVRAVRHLVNRETGEGRVGTVYADRSAMEAADAVRTQRLAAARDRGIKFGEELVLELLYLRAAAT